MIVMGSKLLVVFAKHITMKQLMQQKGIIVAVRTELKDFESHIGKTQGAAIRLTLE
jgi:hypothetical protein